MGDGTAKTTVAILGAGGMLGQDLLTACESAGLATVGLARADCDITDADAVAACVTGNDVIVNCAGYTAVDRAESEEGEAIRVNADGARNVARACRRSGARLVHFSTDYVFDGTATAPYREQDATRPINAYGRSKLAGDEAVLAELPTALIVRVQALFGHGGGNFVATVAAKLQEPGARLRVVDDQVTCPTFTPHLAQAVVALLATDATGPCHVSAAGECTWYALARRIAASVAPEMAIEPVGSADFPTPAPRPAYAVLDKGRLLRLGIAPLPDWTTGVDAYLAALEG